MTTITLFPEKVLGPMKPLHGVGQPPFSGLDFSMFHYLTEAGIPFSRLHDVGGPYGGGRFVDIPNLFRRWDADPADPASYDFTFTDRLITALVESGVEPFFRLGVTIENDAAIKAYRIAPPADSLRWARICEGIIRHYTEGWADGFTYPIRYWEIWNEPDNYPDPGENQMWTGTMEQYFDLYGTAAPYLKARFPHLKIGGYASCGFYYATGTVIEAAKSSPRSHYFIEFFDAFLDYIRAHDCPLDFFSWHSYDTVANTLIHAAYARRRLDEAGYLHTETTCNEWNCQVGLRGTAAHAAHTAAMLLGMQDSPLDSAMFYDARFGTSVYGSLFHPLTAQPFPSYYAFLAFQQLYACGRQVALTCDTPEVYGAAAFRAGHGFILLSNISGQATALRLSAPGCRVIGCRVIGPEATWTPCPLPERLEADTVLLLELAAENGGFPGDPVL